MDCLYHCHSLLAYTTGFTHSVVLSLCYLQSTHTAQPPPCLLCHHALAGFLTAHTVPHAYHTHSVPIYTHHLQPLTGFTTLILTPHYPGLFTPFPHSSPVLPHLFPTFFPCYAIVHSHTLLLTYLQLPFTSTVHVSTTTFPPPPSLPFPHLTLDAHTLVFITHVVSTFTYSLSHSLLPPSTTFTTCSDSLPFPCLPSFCPFYLCVLVPHSTTFPWFTPTRSFLPCLPHPRFLPLCARWITGCRFV